MDFDSKKRNIALVIVALLTVLSWSIYIYIKIKRNNDLKKDSRFPPWPSKCPDYWKVDNDSQNGPTCSNPNKIGICNTDGTPMDFTATIFSGSRGPYYKCNWSKKCNAPWEGIDSLC